MADESSRDPLNELRRAAEQAARDWLPDAEDRFRRLLRAAGSARSLCAAWERTATYLMWRAKPGPALLAYAQALGHTVRDADAAGGMRAIYGACYALGELYETRAQLATIAMLDRAGKLGPLPTLDEALRTAFGTEAFTGLGRLWTLRFRRRLGSDASCGELLHDAVRRQRRHWPDFGRSFMDGTLRFDGPDEVFELVREPRGETPQTQMSQARLYGLYRRRLIRRIVWPALGLATVASALAWFGKLWLALGSPVLFAVAVYWISAVRAAAKWVKVARIESELWHQLNKLPERSSHAVAYDALRRFATDREPFALFLRSFEVEAGETISLPGQRKPSKTDKVRLLDNAVAANQSAISVAAGWMPMNRSILHASQGTSPLEVRLSETLCLQLPVITVSNPAAIVLSRGLPQLEVAHENWERAVRLLVSAARFIVIECTVLAPGVLTELELITAAGRQAETVVILPQARTIEQIQTLREVQALMSDHDLPPRPRPAEADDPALAGFPRKVAEAEVLALDPRGIAAFAGLLP